MFRHQLQVLTFLSFFFLYNSIVTNEGDLPTSNSLGDNVDFLHLENNVEQGQISVLTALKPPKFMSPFSRVNTIATGVIIVITLLNIIVYKLLEPNLGSTQQLQDQEANLGDQKASNKYSTLATEQLPRFSLPEILSATNNFDHSKIIGRGGFGIVYKGVLDSGAITVAIKRLNLASSKQGANEFLTEIEMLSKFRHRNLISLIGYCEDCDEMILVYEYMNRGALAGYLYKTDRGANNYVLSWVQCLKICLDAARGLEYLHTGTNVIHRDMKSSNILLDENLTAKISDFGLSKPGPKNDSCSHVSTQVKGTRGYLDPEYSKTRKLTKKSDVYSFGVVLLEVLSGKAASDFERTEKQHSLANWARRCIKEHTVNEIIDPSLTSEIARPNSLDSFVKIANQSVHPISKKRPTMAQVVFSLESALALQERNDSLIFDRNLLSTGLDFGNQDIEDTCSGQPSVTYYDSDQHHEEQTNKTEQESVDYSSTQHQITDSSNNRDFYNPSMVMKNAFVKTAGPFGGKGGGPWDDGARTTIRKLIICSGPVIQSIQIEYDENGQSKYSKKHGMKEAFATRELFNCYIRIYPYTTSKANNDLILSVMSSNKRTYGPFGTEVGEHFKFPSRSGNKIIGFFGRSGYYLDSLGVYFQPIVPQIIPIGPFGGQGGDLWDDGTHTAIAKLIIYSSKVALDYPSEFLVSVSGYIDKFHSMTIFHSLTFQSNKRTYGPFGREKGKCIKFPSSGNKILGFFGKSGHYLDCLGANVVQS
ncbi:hypothetical protein LguiB_012962 [Lonicera macranthoides]